MLRRFRQAYLLAIVGIGLAVVPRLAESKPREIDTTRMVAMSDGVKLATDVYLPDDGSSKYPVIVVRTPYNKTTGAIIMAALSKFRGYALVIQDMRGRFKSGGKVAIIF